MYSGETIETAAGQCRVLRTDRRTLAITVLPDGRIELAASHDAETEAIRGKVARRLRWIVAQQRHFSEMNGHRQALRYVSGATHRYLGGQYRLKVLTGSDTGVRLTGRHLRVTVRHRQPEEVSALLETWYRRRAAAQFKVRLERWTSWCRERKLPLPRLRLLRMPRRWGSAHRNGLICLNPDLVKAPRVCIDYVITHEICHLRHPLHDHGFFRLLEQLQPDWRSVKARLELAEI